ncbi:hypothetical protein C0992_010868, partial [Termitomyces sp. T32_za158]
SDSDFGPSRYASSVDSHASVPSISPFADPGAGSNEPYPAWVADQHKPMSTEEIEDIFLDLTQKFGFQRDSMRNMFDFTMHLLDSRASRMSANQALLTLHADYIGGQHANYRKWYFAAQLNLDDAVGQSQNPGLQRLKSVKGPKSGGNKSLDTALNRWRNAMNNMSQYDRLRQIALYLLCWGEAGNVRFVPECLCFIFKCADDYYRSPECQNRIDPMPEGLYLTTVVKPLYNFMRDQGYEVQDGKFVRKEKDHDQIIGYDDINQLFWYPEGLARIVLSDNSRLVDVSPAQRFMKFSRIDWSRTFFKTYFEKRSTAHLLVNFNRLSIWTPWKDIYTRLPKRIYAKLLATAEMEIKYKPKVLVSQIWNAVIISMYREHLLSIDHVQRLLYHQVDGQDGRRVLRAPPFFTNQGGNGSGNFFPSGGEAERRISFFASSLTTAFPEPLPVDAMPTFTVLVPHYSEKILLSLREIIREEDQNTRVTLLEYLKQLHPIEWDNFVKDTKILAEENDAMDGAVTTPNEKKADDLPFYCIGFKTSSPEYTLRTRIWASLRAQTLYRTVSGMMNYSKAIKLLYRVENPDIVQTFGGNTERLERELERMARRKFKFTVSMQRFSKFNKEEQENAEFLLRAYPDLQIAYLDEEPGPKGGEARLFSTLIDGHSEFDEKTGKRQPKFRVELPGNPILGDGKSDNQNHAIIFYRGEYLQLIDANQDNYLEECLKIRNILGEFEEYSTSSQSPYAQWGHKEFQRSPVAIVGTREYIFSENIGVLGDIAAGKEQTFGTMTARALAWIGGKLHYGHPDFLNATFMNTRGGVSKAQKGLHLNEDIFAGMNAFGRGGRIKHSEYYQCGKGRDLGFGTILNFQTKIGTGMGEQMLSREYYYLGTQLPIDRFLTFYYGHPGFHINNILVIYSIQVFMVTCNGCFILFWNRSQYIMIELTERGTGKALLRLAKHFLSLSPIFEVFSTQIYSQSILSNLTFGGARYIATGRGFATTRISFSILYSRFAGPSIYLGMRNLLLLLYATLALWIPHLIYFWFSVLSLCIAPFLFNPHQFSYADFIIDYREFLRWMSRGNSRTKASSWYGYCRLSRTMITGYKKKKLGHPSEKLSGDVPRAKWRTVIISEIIWPIFIAALFTLAYLFVKSFPDANGNYPPAPLIRIAVIAVGPVVWNAAILMSLFFVSLFIGPMMESWTKFGSVMATLGHLLCLIGLVAFFEFFWFLELWDASRAVLGVIAIIAIQRAIQKILIAVFLTREYKHDETNRAWWTGKWYGRGLGTSAISQPAREFIVKIVEMSLWGSDLLIAHILLVILTPPILIPYMNRLHSTMLFWLRPSKQIRAPLFSTKQKRQRRFIVIKYTISLWMDYFAKFLRTGNALPSQAPVDHAQEFQKSWDIIKNTLQYPDERQLSRGIKSTNVPDHLRSLVDALVWESTRTEEGGTGACLEYLLKNDILGTLVRLSETDRPSGIQVEVLRAVQNMVVLMDEQFLVHSAVHKAVLRLIRNCVGDDIQEQPDGHKVMGAAKNSVQRQPSEYEQDLVNLLCILCSRIRAYRDLLMIFFHDKHWYHSEPLFSAEELDEEEDDQGEGEDEDIKRGSSPTPSQTTIRSAPASSSKKTEYEFLLFNYLLRFVHREGQIGDLARAGLLFLMDVAMSPGGVLHPEACESSSENVTSDPVQDAALALAEYILDGDFSEVLGAGLGAVYSLLPTKLAFYTPSVSTKPPGNSMTIGGALDSTEEKEKHEEKKKLRALGVEDASNADFKARVDHFLKLLEFLQDVLRRNDVSGSLGASSLVGNAIGQSILDAVRLIFLENVLYPTILECSDTDGSAVAVMSYIEVMIRTLHPGRLADTLMDFLLSEDNEGVSSKQRSLTSNRDGTMPKSLDKQDGLRRRKSSAMVLLELEAPSSKKQSEYFTSMARFTLRDLLLTNLKSKYQPAATSALQLLQSMLLLHPQITTERVLIVTPDPTATSFPHPWIASSKRFHLSDDYDENAVIGPEVENETKTSSFLGAPQFLQPDTTFSTHEREMGLYLTLVSRVDPSHSSDIFSTGYEHYLTDALFSIQSLSTYRITDEELSEPYTRQKYKHRLNVNDPVLAIVLESLRRFFHNTPEFNIALTGVLATLAIHPDRSLAGWLTFGIDDAHSQKGLGVEGTILIDDNSDDRSIDFPIETKLASDLNFLPAATMDEKSRPVIHTIFHGLITQLEHYRAVVDNFDKFLLERRQGLLFSENMTDALNVSLDIMEEPVSDMSLESPPPLPAKSKTKSSTASSLVSFLTPRKNKTVLASDIPESSKPSMKNTRGIASPFGRHYQDTGSIMVEPFSVPTSASSLWGTTQSTRWTGFEDDVFTSSRWNHDSPQTFEVEDASDAKSAKVSSVTLSRLLDDVVLLEESIKELAAIIHARRSLGIDSVRYL